MNHSEWLDCIVAQKHIEIATAKRLWPESVLHEQIAGLPKARPFVEAILGSQKAVIAELKRASPSRGVLRTDPRLFIPETLAKDYAAAGATAISVLTDTAFFWGCKTYVPRVHDAVTIPVLRKDFILDAYQILESRWLKADAILLIARLHETSRLLDLSQLAKSLGMQVLIEVHTEAEIPKALNAKPDCLGINQRDLNTLTIKTASPLRNLIPHGLPVIAESGIQNADDLKNLAAAGFNGFLVGHALMEAEDPGQALRELLTE